MDIKTAFDEAKTKHVVQTLDKHNAHGWLIAALLRAMSGLSGPLSFNRCLRKCGRPTFLEEDGKPDVGQCRGRMDEEKVFSWM